MNKIKAVQIIGTQRSGSNLLRVMLDTMDDVFAPHPPHILQRFLPLLPYYGSLNNKQNWEELIHDVCELVRLNPVTWENIELDEAEIARNCRTFSLYEIFRVIHELSAQQVGAHIWVNKSMKNIHYIKGFDSIDIHPLYIYLCRDGRDVALSFKKAIVGEKHIYSIAKCWQEDQAACLELQKNIDKAFFFALKYEDLISQPDVELKKICSFIGVDYTEKMLEYYKSKESEQTSAAGEMWRNVKQPVLKDNKNKFLNELSLAEIRIFETVAGKELAALGYKLVTPAEDIKAFTSIEIEEFELKNKQLKAQFSQQAATVDKQKREPQERLLQSIRERKLKKTEN